ncbi:MAG: hypothetical protein KJ072_06055 [Verrucomicrobia bacterium]|nr:hypothetical protein [Verrucomicrobiota bacterium]
MGKYTIREITADERKQLLTEASEKVVSVDGTPHYFVIESDDDLFLVDALLAKRKIANPSKTPKE